MLPTSIWRRFVQSETMMRLIIAIEKPSLLKKARFRLSLRDKKNVDFEILVLDIGS